MSFMWKIKKWTEKEVHDQDNTAVSKWMIFFILPSSLLVPLEEIRLLPAQELRVSSSRLHYSVARGQSRIVFKSWSKLYFW